MPWRSGYHYCTTSFSKTWTQVLRRFKSCSWRVGDSRWWGSLTMVPAGNKAKRLSLVNHTTKTIHHHHSLLTKIYFCKIIPSHLCFSLFLLHVIFLHQLGSSDINFFLYELLYNYGVIFEIFFSHFFLLKSLT